MDDSITEFAERQHGLIAVGQLRELGLDDAAVGRRVDTGLLHRIHRGVYAVGHRLLSMRARYLAAVLACGPVAALSHRAAADVLGLRRNSTHIEVTVPRGRKGPRGITVYRSRMIVPADVMEVDNIPVTSVARTLLDLASVLTERDLGYALDRAERLQLFDLTSIEEVLDRARGRRGAKALRRAIDAWRPADVRNDFEARFHELVRKVDLPTPGANVPVDGERYTHEVDASGLHTARSRSSTRSSITAPAGTVSGTRTRTATWSWLVTAWCGSPGMT